MVTKVKLPVIIGASMKSSAKFSLQWSDFEKNVTTSFKEIRRDFCDVTLVGEGKMKIEAHKVILAASSDFFLDLLRQKSHPNLLLYMRGIKDDQLSAVLDFIYQGQTSVAQDDLEDFLKVAEELQIKGLSDMNSTVFNKEFKGKKNETTNANSQNVISTPFTLKSEAIDQNFAENRFEIAENIDLSYGDKGETRGYRKEIELVKTIKSMLLKVDGIWNCRECGKTNTDQSNMRKHIENKHTEGVPHTCDQCGILSR